MRKSELIGKVNARWWRIINEKMNVTVQSRQTHRIQVLQTGEAVRIIVPSENARPEVFTYEVARLYLLAKEWHIADYLIMRFTCEPLLFWAVSENIFSWVGTQLEALIILPVMQEGGYTISPLHTEFAAPPASDVAWQQLSKGFKQSYISSHSIALFVHQFFVLQVAGHFYSGLHYFTELLQSICPSLYEVLQKLIEDWTVFQKEESLETPDAYKLVIKDFIHAIGNWCTCNFHIQPLRSF